MTRILERPYAAVCIRQLKPQGKVYTLDTEKVEPIVFLAPGTELVELKDGARILDEDGNEIRPEHRFYRTAGTIFTYHTVADML